MIRESGTEFDAWLASACMPGRVVRAVLRQYGDSCTFYRTLMDQETEASDLVPSRFLQLLRQNAEENVMKMKKLTDQHCISTIRFGCDQYPESLLSIDDPPAILFCQGNTACLNKRSVAMVGSRAASYTGQKAARMIAKELSAAGITVISGLAGGIDAAAHSGCIEGGSPTVAVSGCGLDRVYPSCNTELRNTILDGGGLILSEYAPGEKPYGWHFPVRNRIIAGLSSALILVEARIRSGSMTSVGHALDQGKDVFVYPGDPSSAHFEGNHQLLREGGIYFTSAQDILEDMHWLDNPPAVRQNIDCSKETKGLGPEQTALIEALKPGPLSFEELLSKTKLTPSVLMSTLTILQISGIIEALPGKIYQMKH